MNIEQLKKITGMDEDELSSYILDRCKAGATNEEILDELTSKTSNGKLKDKYQELSNQLIQERKNRLAQGWDIPWKKYFTKETSPSWRSHTMPEGNSTPDDNGWTDLKKLGLSIEKAFTPNKAIDPLWQLGVIDDAFGDDSKLKMWNQNVESRKQREAQYEYNKMLKAMDEAQQEKEKSVAATKAASDERIAQEKAQKETDDKNRETFLNTINDLNKGRKLNDTEKAILKVQYNRLNDTDRNEYQTVYNKLYGVTTVSEDNVDNVEPTTTYETPQKQSQYKNHVTNKRNAIKAMENGTAKQTAMKELNAFIKKYNSCVEGGLGELYNAKQIKAAGPKTEYKLGDKTYGSYGELPDLTGNLRWTKTGNTNNKNENEFVVEKK